MKTPGEKKKSHTVISDFLEKAKQAENMTAAIDIILSNNETLKAKDICKLMDWDYSLKGPTVTQRRYEWRKSHIFGVGSQGSIKLAPDSQHHVSAVAFVPKCLDRSDPEVTERALSCGWVQSKNRNKVLVWNRNRELGRIEWWISGRVKVHVKKPHNMGTVKRLVSLAFFSNGLIFEFKIFAGFVDNFKWKEHHDVHRTGRKQRLSYMKILTYKKLGLIIKLGDKSHPYDVEVEYVKPDWAEKLEFLMEQLTKFVKSGEKSQDPGGMYV